MYHLDLKNMKKAKINFTESLAVWGKLSDIKPLLKGLKGVRITDSGVDSCDCAEPVVEISFDPRVISVAEIFHTVSNPETEVGGLANSVSHSAERW